MVVQWSHYIFLSRISNKDERDFYEIEAVENSWTLRELKRQFDSGIYASKYLTVLPNKEEFQKILEEN